MTQWTPQQRAEAVGLALALGADKAHEATGIPRRTISAWIAPTTAASNRRAPELEAAIVASREAVTSKLWEAVTVGTEQVLAGLRDPKARLGDKAQALRIVAEQHALINGTATANIALAGLGGDGRAVYVDTLSTEDKAALRDAIDRELALRDHTGDDDDALAAARAAYLAALHGRTGRVDVVVALLSDLTPTEAAELDARLGETPRLLTEGTPTWD